MKVFWSWQADRPSKTSRQFVKHALEIALIKLGDDFDLDPAERPEIDHDTKDEPGLVEIVNTIFKKIKNARVFVGDITPIAETEKGKKVANPNVMMELGYALHVLGYQNIILVCNAAYGAKPEDLPFDLRHRRGPITFKLEEKSDKKTQELVRDELVKELVSALQLNLKAMLNNSTSAPKFFLHPSRDGDPSTWLSEGEPIEKGDFNAGNGSIEKFKVVEGVRSYFRIAPASWSKNKPSRLDVQSAKDDVALWRMGQWQAGDGGSNTLGVVALGYWNGEHLTTHTATQWIQETGEIWAFDGAVTTSLSDHDYLAQDRILFGWATELDQTLRFYKNFGAISPFRIEVGVSPLMGTHWGGKFFNETTPAFEQKIAFDQTEKDWNEGKRMSFLTKAYNALCDAYTRPNVDESWVRHRLNR